MEKQPLQFSHLDDDEYLKHLLTKPVPTDEDVESALRIEHLLGTYRGMLEQVHTIASQGHDPAVTLTRIRRLTAPEHAAPKVLLQ